jgi:2-polyprenyl-3-methyl-5-hydroxy-6-metoxy-1,4-benzoquinol methylase
MKYKIKVKDKPDYITIDSQNAAKSFKTPASALVKWLRKRDITPSALDYGCGKLRYTHYIAQRSKHIGIVDSKVQLKRTQWIHLQKTSVETYAGKIWPSCTIQYLEDFWKQPARHYHFILCANVLSAIPSTKVRAKSLRAIHESLEPEGQVLFVNQHTNSRFTEIRKRQCTTPYLDGWIANSEGRASYYGILNKSSVIKLVSRFGFYIDQAWNENQSNFILVSKK